jgi:hypothetical protein
MKEQSILNSMRLFVYSEIMNGGVIMIILAVICILGAAAAAGLVFMANKVARAGLVVVVIAATLYVGFALAKSFTEGNLLLSGISAALGIALVVILVQASARRNRTSNRAARPTASGDEGHGLDPDTDVPDFMREGQ